jgi:cytochrome c oxidase subunit 2
MQALRNKSKAMSSEYIVARHALLVISKRPIAARRRAHILLAPNKKMCIMRVREKIHFALGRRAQGGKMRIRRPPVVHSVFILFSLIFSFALSACSAADTPQSFITPKSDNANAIYQLFTPIFWAALIVFVVVEALLVYSAFRFRARDDSKSIPMQVHGNTPLEIGWTIAPAIILGIIFLLTAQTLNAVSTPPKSANVLNVKVLGHQWWWEFQYPDIKTVEGKPLVTAGDLHVSAGSLVSYTLESVDVIHSFWVPQLGGKTDLVPGHVNRGFFNAPQLGDIFGQCAEFCGAEHAQMRFRVFVQNDADFQTWVKRQQALPEAPAGLAKQGADLFAASACIGCHVIAGTKAAGLVGPNLTHFGSRTTIASGEMPNTPENLRKWLRNPEGIKPGNDMSVAMGVVVNNWGADADKNIEALAAYLESLK